MLVYQRVFWWFWMVMPSQELSRTHRVSHLAVELEQPRWRQFTLIWFRLCRLLQNKKKRGWERLEEQNKCWKLLTRKLCFNPKLFFLATFLAWRYDFGRNKQWAIDKRFCLCWYSVGLEGKGPSFGQPWQPMNIVPTWLCTHKETGQPRQVIKRNVGQQPIHKFACKGSNMQETPLPTLKWLSICCLIIASAIAKRKTKQQQNPLTKTKNNNIYIYIFRASQRFRDGEVVEQVGTRCWPQNLSYSILWRLVSFDSAAGVSGDVAIFENECLMQVWQRRHWVQRTLGVWLLRASMCMRKNWWIMNWWT